MTTSLLEVTLGHAFGLFCGSARTQTNGSRCYPIPNGLATTIFSSFSDTRPSFSSASQNLKSQSRAMLSEGSHEGMEVSTLQYVYYCSFANIGRCACYEVTGQPLVSLLARLIRPSLTCRRAQCGASTWSTWASANDDLLAGDRTECGTYPAARAMEGLC